MVVGLGGLVACFMKAAYFYAANPIIGVDIVDNKKETVRALHGNLFINAATENIPEVLQRELGIKEVDVIIEATGNIQSIANTVPLLGNDGRYIMVGHVKQGESVELKWRTISGGTEGRPSRPPRAKVFAEKDIPRFVKLFQAGLLDIDDLVTHRTKLDDINGAIEMMRAGKARRIMIDL